MPRSTFMSHAHAENALCMRYAEALHARGLDVWIDLQSLQNGHFLGQDIQHELQQRNAFLLMMSPDSLASFWVRLERDAYLGLMAADPTRMMLPIRILPCEVPPFMNALTWIDAVNKPFAQVVEEIALALGAHDIPPPPPSDEWEPIPILSRLARLDFKGWRVRATGVELNL